MYSHSRLSTFESCPLKFKFQYIDKLSEGHDTIEAFLGSRVHDSLEKIYKDKKFQKLMTKEELLEFYEREWIRLDHNDILIVRKEYDKENYKDMGKKFLEDYYDRFYPFDQATTIGLEMRVVITLPSGKKLQGYIDRLDEKEGVYEIHDYKTSNTLMEQDKADQDRQLALYAIAVRERFPDAKDVKLVWHYLAFNKTITSSRCIEHLEQLKKDVDDLIKEIEHTSEFKAKPSALCDWCEFRKICPAWAHLATIEHEPVKKWNEDEGVRLADKYSELIEQKNVLEKELEEIKEQLFEFSEQLKVDTIFGTTVKLKLWHGTNFSFPAKDTLDRKKLVEELKNLGHYEETLSLDTWNLSKLMKSWSPIEQAAIAKYATKKKVTRIYPSKRT